LTLKCLKPIILQQESETSMFGKSDHIVICNSDYYYNQFTDYEWSVIDCLHNKYDMDYIEPGEFNLKFISCNKGIKTFILECETRPTFTIIKKHQDQTINNDQLTNAYISKIKNNIYIVKKL
jgi:hypothetical protein